MIDFTYFLKTAKDLESNVERFSAHMRLMGHKKHKTQRKSRSKQQQKESNSELPSPADLRKKYSDIISKEYKDISDDVLECFKKKVDPFECCPFCHCCTHQIRHSILDSDNQFWKSRKHFKNVWGFSKDFFCYCSMHATERLIENLLVRICKNDPNAIQFLIDWFKKLNKTRGRDIASRLGVHYSVPNEESGGPINLNIFSKEKHDEPEYEKIGFGMIPWKHCKLILLTCNLWIPELIQEMKSKYSLNDFISSKEIVLWDQLKKIWSIIHANSDIIEKWKSSDFLEQENELKKFGEYFFNAYQVNSHSWYLHIIIVHTIPLIRKLGTSLNRFTNQSTEACNHFHKILVERIAKPHTKPEDLILNRLLYLILKDPKNHKPLDDKIKEKYRKWLDQTNKKIT
jgi:hypothetical protein